MCSLLHPNILNIFLRAYQFASCLVTTRIVDCGVMVLVLIDVLFSIDLFTSAVVEE